jgi:anti-sigma B factor antagonist
VPTSRAKAVSTRPIGSSSGSSSGSNSVPRGGTRSRFRIFPNGYARCVSGGAHPTGSDAIPLSGDEAGEAAGAGVLNLPVLAVTGELDLAVAPWLRDQLDALFVGGASSLVVDMSGAAFLDSTALGVLVGALNKCRELGGQVHLVVTEPQILRVLRITGLTHAFALHQSSIELESGRTEQWKS